MSPPLFLYPESSLSGLQKLSLVSCLENHTACTQLWAARGESRIASFISCSFVYSPVSPSSSSRRPLAAALDPRAADPGAALADCRGLYTLLWNEMGKHLVEIRVGGEQTQTVMQVGELGTWEGSRLSPSVRALGYRNNPNINCSSFERVTGGN